VESVSGLPWRCGAGLTSKSGVFFLPPAGDFSFRVAVVGGWTDGWASFR
jgi:hypothetical protein